MSAPEFRSRLYGRYVEAGDPAAPCARADDATPGLASSLKAVVRRHFPPSREAKIVDLGCGAGLLLHFARQAGYRDIAGVDISPQQVALARRLGIAGVRQGDLMAALAGLAEESHDAVVCFDVIEHLTRDELVALVDAVRRVLKPGGRWIVHTANAESPFFGRVRYGDLTHEQAFTRASLRQVLLASSFSRVACYEDAPVPGRPGGTLRWLLWKLVRLPVLLYLIAESGAEARHSLLSQNLVCVAIR